jgi:hypothetical protein
LISAVVPDAGVKPRSPRGQRRPFRKARWILAELALRCEKIRICCTANVLAVGRVLFRGFLVIRRAAASDSVRCSDARLIFVNTLRPPTHIVKASPEEGRWHGLLGVDFFNRVLLQAPH